MAANKKITAAARKAIAKIVVSKLAEHSKAQLRRAPPMLNVTEQLNKYLTENSSISFYDLEWFRDRMQEYLNQFKADIETFKKGIETAQTLADVTADLVALEAEFPKLVSYDLEKRVITVTTDAITLKNSRGKTVELGRFNMCLLLDESGIYDTVFAEALDPNPHANARNVTHPHVNAGEVCLGDGSGAMQKCLTQGRIFDFFELFNNVLHTYGEGQAYAELYDWDGEEDEDGEECGSCGSECDLQNCRRCGYCLCDDCLSTCDACDGGYCDECMFTCAACATSSCVGCANPGLCSNCEKECCRDCLVECVGCLAVMCDKCLPNGRACPKCKHVRGKKK